MFEDMTPEELVGYGVTWDFNVPGYFVKVAYPVERSFYYKDKDSHQSELQEIKNTRKPVVIDAIDEHMDKIIVFGEKVYDLPNSYEGFKCLENCAEELEAKAMSDCPCLKWSEVYGAGGIDCNPGIGGLAGEEFCNFMQHFNSNVCVESHFMIQTGLSDSICYVSAECAGQA